MSTWSLFKLFALGAVGVLLSISPTSAQTCTGTVVLAAADGTTSPGQRFGGNYEDTLTSNDYRQALNETLSSGKSRLIHTWTFNSVPAGSASIIREGYRLGSADGDDFKFQAGYDYNDGNGIHNIFGSFCTINSETEASSKCSFSTTTTDTATWTVSIVDTVTGSGTALSAVAVDYLALCIE